MDQPSDTSPAQVIADTIVDSATMIEAGRISLLARQGLQDPASLTPVQARHIFAAYLLLFDPLVRLRDETPPPALLSFVQLPFPGRLTSPEPRRPDRASTTP